MAEVPDSGTHIVIDGHVYEAETIRAHLENVGSGAQAYTSRARAISGDLNAVELCPKHQGAAVHA